ncbi:MAG: leucine-rich repeat protein, partial [Lachnospiraceae bacterium]|nr:leucine-rich repeat protein [Lachnospiraceae bacterium]
ITIPSKVNKIGSKAFYGCKKLKKITIKTTKLTKKKVGSQAFKGIAAKATIKVPKKKLSAYKKMLRARGVGAKAKIKK